jgi:hypothetical protein
MSLANQTAKRELKIAQDCVHIVKTTTKPDVFFSRLDLLIEKAEKLKQLEPYIKFSGASPSAVFAEVIRDYPTATKQFIIRYFMDVYDHARELKTDKAKLNRYQKFYDSMQPYYYRLNDEHIDYIETKFRVYTADLKKQGEK